ncbi:MAG: acetoin utilization AcuB family protein [Symbiobacteriia bacterium]
MLVEEIMSRPVIAVEPEHSVLDALNLARLKRIRHLPVVESLGPGGAPRDLKSQPAAPAGAGLVGIVSDRDLRDACPAVVAGGATDVSGLAAVKMSAIMHPHVITIHPLDPIEEASRLLYEHRIGCLPVVSGAGLVGILTETDVLRAIAELLGVTSPGSHLEVEVPDRPGHLAEVSRIISSQQVNIASVLMTPGRRENSRLLSMRVQTIDPRRLVRALEEAGYRVIWPTGPKLA